MRAQLQAPRAPQDEVERDDAVVQARGPEAQRAAQSEGVLGVVPRARAIEEGQVPVLGHIPVEAVEAVDGAGGHPETVDDGRARRPVALQRAEQDHGEGRRVLERVGQVLPAPARGPPDRTAAHAAVLDQALAQADEGGDREDHGYDDDAAASTVGTRCCRTVGPQEHAERYVEIAQDLRVARQHVSQQDIAELAVLRLRDAAEGYPAQHRAEAHATSMWESRRARQRYGEEREEHEEIRKWQPIPCQHEIGIPMGEDPEDEEGEEEYAGEDAG